MKQDLNTGPQQPGETSKEHLIEIAKLYGVSIQEAPVWLEYDRALAAWRSRADVLVTCLCMGGKHYAHEVSAMKPQKGDAPRKPVPTSIRGVFGEERIINVIPTIHRLNEGQRQELATKANTARSALSAYLEIPAAQWSRLADTIMGRPKLLLYLIGMGILTEQPVKPGFKP